LPSATALAHHFLGWVYAADRHGGAGPDGHHVGSLFGQRSALREVNEREHGSFGFDFTVAQPQGEFRRTGNIAPGFSGFGVLGSTLGLRIDGGWMVYENRYQGAGLSTTSQIATLGAGPQLTFGSGSLRIYGFATVGGAWFFTGLSSGNCGCSTGDLHVTGDLTTSTSAGGGVLLFCRPDARRSPSTSARAARVTITCGTYRWTGSLRIPTDLCRPDTSRAR
jgi:hypothetical protein